jgi:two-component system NtrC family sensor kinase
MSSMGARGIKSRIFFQLWALFFLSMLFVDILVLFILFDTSFSPYKIIKRNDFFYDNSTLHQQIGENCLVDPVALGEAFSETISKEIYKGHRKIQNVSFFLVVINSLLFAFLGTTQLSRSYFKPLQRLAKRAESYQDETYPFFSVRKEDNEFSILSTSLNKMLHRIAEDKRLLKETIDSLEVANGELKKAHKDVIRAEKLATVGRLTSGIAHEIGNPLGIVLGYLDLMKQDGVPREERTDYITRSEKEITRINDIIRKLLDMSRENPGEERSISVHWLLDDLLSVIQDQSFASDISFEKKFNAQGDLVAGDPDQLRQVFLNILLNSIDAVKAVHSGKKKIVLKTKTMSGDATLELEPQKKYIYTEIVDNGPGFQIENLARVFDPFFTTKDPGEGTGLGLSVSFMIVEKFGGRLVATNDVEMGAAVQVVFPVP